MDNTYLLATLDDTGIRKPTAAASTRADLAGIAEKVITGYIKNGYTLANVWEALEGYDLGPLYKAYYLKRNKTKKQDASLVMLELYELPVDTAATFDPEYKPIR